MLGDARTALVRASTLLLLCAVLASSYEEIAQQLMDEHIGPRGPIDEKRLIKLLDRKIDKILPQTESSYAVPCVFVPGKRLIMLPNTMCRGLSKNDKAVLTKTLHEMARYICLKTFRYGDSPYESMNEIEWAAETYRRHLLKSYEVIDTPLRQFSSGETRVVDFIYEVKKALVEGGYVQHFIAELKRRADETRASVRKGKIKDSVEKVLADCDKCRVYTSSINAKTLAASLREQETCCKVFARIFPDSEDGKGLLIEIYNNPRHRNSSGRGCEVFRTTSSNIEKIFGLYESHGEAVAADVLRTSLLDPDPNAEIDLESEQVKALIKKEARVREAAGDELARSGAAKKKTSKRAKARVPSEEKDEPPAHEDQGEPSEECILEIKPEEAPPRHAPHYRLLRRVLRWGGPLDAIKRSLDSSKDRRYRGQEMEEIKRQKDLHDFADVVHILEETDYFFRTERGMSAFATLEIDGNVTDGMLEIGLRDDKRTIYHLLFNPKRAKMEKVLSPEFEDGDDVSEGGSGDLRSEMWCKIARAGGCYTLTYTNPFEESQVYKKLVLHPYRPQRGGPARQ